MQPHDTTRPTFIDLPPRAKDIAGLKFGRLVALGPVGVTSNKSIRWLCQCDCGNTSVATTSNLCMGSTLSCGCLSVEALRQRVLKHGQSGTPLYRLWHSMIRRCTDPKRKAYADYGGRGITVCDQWRHDFQAFFDHISALPHFGEKGYTFDRIDNDGNYEPGNVRFATRIEQSRNRRITRLLTYEGKTQCLAAWAEELGVSSKILDKRLRTGWSVERTLSTPVDAKRSLRAQKAAAAKGIRP